MTFDEMARVEGERGGVAGRYVVAKKDLQAGQQVLREPSKLLHRYDLFSRVRFLTRHPRRSFTELECIGQGLERVLRRY
jgi:hypothetical protein